METVHESRLHSISENLFNLFFSFHSMFLLCNFFQSNMQHILMNAHFRDLHNYKIEMSSRKDGILAESHSNQAQKSSLYSQTLLASYPLISILSDTGGWPEDVQRTDSMKYVFLIKLYVNL